MLQICPRVRNKLLNPPRESVAREGFSLATSVQHPLHRVLLLASPACRVLAVRLRHRPGDHGSTARRSSLPHPAGGVHPKIDDGLLDEPVEQGPLQLIRDRAGQEHSGAATPRHPTTTTTTSTWLLRADGSRPVGHPRPPPGPRHALSDDFVGSCWTHSTTSARGFEFFVNPWASEGRPRSTTREEEDAAWDAIWIRPAGSTRPATMVEMAIPFSSLRFQRSEASRPGASPPSAPPRGAAPPDLPRPLDRTTAASSARSPR